MIAIRAVVLNISEQFWPLSRSKPLARRAIVPTRAAIAKPVPILVAEKFS